MQAIGLSIAPIPVFDFPQQRRIRRRKADRACKVSDPSPKRLCGKGSVNEFAQKRRFCFSQLLRSTRKRLVFFVVDADRYCPFHGGIVTLM